MATPVMMPKVGISVESCILTKWHKKVGDTVNIGDLLFTYETDKSTLDEEATVSGTLLAAFFEEGDDVPVMINVCVIGNSGENFEEFNNAPKEEETEVTKKNEIINTPVVTTSGQSSGFASPRARAFAKKTGADISLAIGTGPNGRVIEYDVRNIDKDSIALGAAVYGDYKDIKLSNIRKVIAKSMQLSLSTTAQLTNNISFNAGDILAFRKKIKENGEQFGLGNITIGDMIVFAVSRTLKNHKDLNAHFMDNSIRQFENTHIGIAVDTERGLMVPTLFDANTKTINDISNEIKELAAACQKGDISPDKLTGGSFTVTNLGSFGIETFTPVLNPPQTGILGVNTIVEKVRSNNGKIEVYPSMSLSLTYDHRAVDGAPASRFLMELKANLERFEDFYKEENI